MAEESSLQNVLLSLALGGGLTLFGLGIAGLAANPSDPFVVVVFGIGVCLTTMYLRAHAIIAAER